MRALPSGCTPASASTSAAPAIGTDLAELLVVDETERLSTDGLEHLRDVFDRTFFGMPSLEKRLSRYPQLYSRIGFAHHYRSLQGDELILKINGLSIITDDVVEAARSTLVIGVT